MTIARLNIWASIGLSAGLMACAEGGDTVEQQEAASPSDVSSAVASEADAPELTPAAMQASAQPASFTGEVSMNGSVENGDFIAALYDALGKQIDLDLQFSYFAVPGSFDIS